MLQLRFGVCVCVGLLVLVPSMKADVVFNPFVSSPPGAPIGFSYAGDEFVGTIQKDGTGVMYSTDLTGGNVQPFAPTVSLAPNPASEHFIASSLGLGGFPNRDLYVASGNGVMHVTHTGSSGNLFVSGLVGDVRGILFDSVGTFDFNMLITTNAGSIYEVDHNGVVTPLASTGEDTEGLDVAPLGGNLGAFNGDLIVASEGTGRIRALDPISHSLTVFATVAGGEELSVVPLNLGASGNPVEGMYGADYSFDVVKADASQFTAFKGDVIVTGEFTHRVSDIHFDGTTFVVTDVGHFPHQPEDGIFVTAAIITGGGSVPEPGTLLLLGTALAGLAGFRYRRRTLTRSSGK